jgi:hypothetical protein
MRFSSGIINTPIIPGTLLFEMQGLAGVAWDGIWATRSTSSFAVGCNEGQKHQEHCTAHRWEVNERISLELENKRIWYRGAVKQQITASIVQALLRGGGTGYQLPIERQS